MTEQYAQDKPKFDYLNEVTDNNQEIISQIVALFLQEAPKDISQLVDLCNKENWEATGKQAHKMKSSVGNFGLTSLKELFFAIEQAGKQQTETEKIPEWVAQANERMLKVIAELKAQFNLS